MRRIALPAALVLSLVPLAAAGGAPSWSWPEQPKNLKVLGPDVKGEKLAAVMRGFTRALGVRCLHCHVGKEGQPFSSWDFASDDNPNKDRAREMLRMLADIQTHLAKIQPSESTRVEVGCYTCHRGRPRPTTIAEELQAAYAKGGAEAMHDAYDKLRAEYYGAGTLDFGPAGLEELGRRLLDRGDTAGAIAAFRLNSEQHPDSGRVWHALAAAYERAGQTEIAAIYYRKALEVDPDDDDALAKLRELGDARPTTDH